MAPGPAISSSCSYSTPSRAWSAGCPAACTRPSQRTTAGTIATSLQNATGSPVWIFAARAAARTDSKITQSGRKQAEDCLARIGAGCLGGRRRPAPAPQFRVSRYSSVGTADKRGPSGWLSCVGTLSSRTRPCRLRSYAKSFASGSRQDRVPSTCSSRTPAPRTITSCPPPAAPSRPAWHGARRTTVAPPPTRRRAHKPGNGSTRCWPT